MFGWILLIFIFVEVELYNIKKLCYVMVGKNVYDVIDFVDVYFGGGDLVFDYVGKDIIDIFKDEVLYVYFEVVYEVFDDFLVGFLEDVFNGVSVNGKVKVNG